MLPRIREHVQRAGRAWASASATPPPPAPSARVADAVVIGTALVQLLEDQPRDGVAPAAAAFMREIRAALDA